MGKYRLRYFIAVGVLLVLPAFTCGIGPVLRDLIQRVEMLETESELLTMQVEALEGRSDTLEAQVGVLTEESAALQAENDAQQEQIDALAGAGAEVLHVFDANGTDLGIFAGREAELLFGDTIGYPRILWIFLPDFGITFKVNPETGKHLLDREEFFFTEPDCQGTAYSQLAGMLLQPNIGSNSAWFVTSTEPVSVVVRSYGETGNTIPPDVHCNGTITSIEMVVSLVTPVDPETDLGLSFPLPAPLVVAPAP